MAAEIPTKPPVTELRDQHEALDVLVPDEYSRKEKKLVRRIDARLMPLLFLIIVMNYLDRNALANARDMGIEADLGLVGTQYNTAISVLFAGYIGLQVPSNAIITRVRPSLYLPGCMVVWGVVSGLTATVRGFGGLVAVRFFLGLVEAPYFPGSLFLLSSWYTRKELALRTSILYAGSLLAGGFGGLIGAGVQSGLDGARGIASWRWLFIIEAAITVVVATVALFVLPDFPHTTKFLSAEERAFATRRLQLESGTNDASTERVPLLAGVKMAVVDYKVWLLALIIITKTSAGAVTSFIPTLVATLGYNQVSSLLLVAPPYVFATLVALFVSSHSDRCSERCGHIVLPILFATAGFVLAAALPTPTNPNENFAARYAALFLMLGGVYGSYEVALAWVASTAPTPAAKRAAAFAIVNTVGNVAQVYSPYMYPGRDGPGYRAAMVANACFCVACGLAALALRWCLVRENGRLGRGERDGGAAAGWSAIPLGESSNSARVTGFRYVL